MMRSREAVYWLGFAGLLLAAISYGQLVDRFDTNHWLRIALFAAMGVIGLLLVFGPHAQCAQPTTLFGPARTAAAAGRFPQRALG